MARGRLIPPDLDDRTWQDIVDEAKALIPTYAPEWTDHNPSDLGVALIELFAWLAEGMIYRLNRVPDKNFIEFLNLVGITRDPATPASTNLTYRLAGGMPPLLVPKGSQAATQQTESEEAIVFETDQDLTVWPISTALYIRKVGGANQYENITANLADSRLSEMTIDIPVSQSVMITFGFEIAKPEEMTGTEEMALLFQFSKPARENDVQIAWLYSHGTAEPMTWHPIPMVSDGTDGFQKNGIVSFTVPGDWASQNPKDWTNIPPDPTTDQVDQSLFWVGIRVSNLLGQPLELGLERILFNSVSATNALTITQPELLGTSNGKPFQFFELQNRPLFKRPGAKDPYDHLEIQVREPLVGGGFGDWTPWTHLDDFPEGAGDHFRLNPVTGTISFGNYDSTKSPDGHGTIPPLGSEIRASTYRYVVGGTKGNVPSGTITVVHTPPPSPVFVTNFDPATGGSDEEAVEETKRRGPNVLRNRYRAVTIEDYEYLAREATTDVKKVRCLPPRLLTQYDTTISANVGKPWTYAGLNRSVGNVNVIIIPDASLSDPTPMPSEELLQEVSDYLEERRVLTNMLHVTFPRYLPIDVDVEIKVWQKALDTGLVTSTAQVQSDIVAKIREFLHPLLGGLEKEGWEVGQDILISSLFEFIQPDSDVGFVSSLTVEAGTPLYQPPGRPFPIGGPGVWVQLADYEIICNGTHTVDVDPI